MWRVLSFIALLAVAAFAAGWLAERPGFVTMTFAGYEIRTSVAVAAIGIVILALFLSLLWSGIITLIRLPSRIGFASRARRRARGYQAVSRGMVAVGAGDSLGARRYAVDAERYLGAEPLTLLLKAQAAQVSGDRAGAEAAFSRMAEESETRVLGLRGLFVEARRKGDADLATTYALEAAKLAPAAAWASDAVLEMHCAQRDWKGALRAMERRASLGVIDKTTARRQRAVLQTAYALDRAETDRGEALSAAQEAVKLAPDLVPAAALTGRLLAEKGELRRAAKILEAAFKLTPHPEIAATYLDLRAGDSALDRLKRAETLQKFAPGTAEAALTVARAALDAREYARARSALQPLLQDRPTVRTCLLMSDLEQAQNNSLGAGREWLARATRAPRDPAWMADGIVCDRWAPVSPVTGKLDAFVWQSPPEILAAPEFTLEDPVTGDLDETPKALPFMDAERPIAENMQPVAAPRTVEPFKPVLFPVRQPPDDPGPDLDDAPRRSGFSG